MLIGDNNFNKMIIDEIFDRYGKYQILLIGNIGSLEMGTYRYNSDYDIGVLLKDKMAPMFDKFTFDRYEITLINLHWMLNTMFHQPNLCDFTSFNECIQMLMSTHTYDPYGIQSPLLQCFSLNMNQKAVAKLYLDKVMELYNFQNFGDRVNVKRCLTLIYYLLCLNWIMKVGNYPPISIDILKQIIVENDVLSLIHDIQIENEIWNSEMLQDRSSTTHFSYKLIKLKQEHITILNHMIDDLKSLYSNMQEIKKDMISDKTVLKIMETKANHRIEIQNFTYHSICK